MIYPYYIGTPDEPTAAARPTLAVQSDLVNPLRPAGEDFSGYTIVKG